VNRADAVAFIQESLEALNSERESDEQIEISERTPLLGGDSKLDSLAFVSFVAELEERLLDDTDEDFMLVGELGPSENHPFRDVAALADHIVGMAAAL
jgi:acyl carrier protein